MVLLWCGEKKIRLLHKTKRGGGEGVEGWRGGGKGAFVVVSLLQSRDKFYLFIICSYVCNIRSDKVT